MDGSRAPDWAFGSSVDWLSLPAVAGMVEHKLRSLGVPLRPSSRIWDYCKTARILATAEKRRFVDDPRGAEQIVQACYELTQIAAMLTVMARATPKPGVVDCLMRMVDDAVLPQDQSNPNTPGRNAQFEMFLAAVAECAGLRCRWTEPDLMIRCAAREVAVAAKRIKAGSVNAVARNIKDAVDQIGRRRTWGVVALDVSAARNPENIVSGVGRADEFQWIFAQFIDKTIQEVVVPAFERVDHPLVIGGLVFFHAHAFAADRGMITLRGIMHEPCSAANEFGTRLFDDFLEALKPGLSAFNTCLASSAVGGAVDLSRLSSPFRHGAGGARVLAVAGGLGGVSGHRPLGLNGRRELY